MHSEHTFQAIRDDEPPAGDVKDRKVMLMCVMCASSIVNARVVVTHESDNFVFVRVRCGDGSAGGVTIYHSVNPRPGSVMATSELDLYTPFIMPVQPRWLQLSQ